MFEQWDEAGGEAEQEQDAEQDRDPSFEDSDRFEEDSLCSYLSDTESLCNNWRGWKKCPTGVNQGASPMPLKSNIAGSSDGDVPSLLELCSREVAKYFPFDVVERRISRTHPSGQLELEHLQKRIAFWSFPESDEDIRLYSCLANGSAEEFQKGEHLFRGKLVKDLIQIGFHLSASVVPPQSSMLNGNSIFNVAITFDRRRITTCSCTCRPAANIAWCAHVVAVCLQRIHQASSATLRASLSESFERLSLIQLKKFAQYFVSELPRQMLPTAQRLLDELLCATSAINTIHGAPDPTDPTSAGELGAWCLDENMLHENIRNLLVKFCIPTPLVCSDVNYLNTCAPPAATEWSNLLRPLRGREPEGMWNLLSIIREMFRRRDNNAVSLLTIVTDECLLSEQIVGWWYGAKVSHGYGGNYGGFARIGNGPSVSSSQHASASLMDEIGTLWRLAVLNPQNTSADRACMKRLLQDYHSRCLEKICKSRDIAQIPHHEHEQFSGFKPAIEVCFLTWNDFPIEGLCFERVNTPKSSLCSQNPNEENRLENNLTKRLPDGNQVTTSSFAQDSENDSPEDEPQPSTSTVSDNPPEKIINPMDVVFVRAEALYAHGYLNDACRLAVSLAEEMLNNPPDFTKIDPPGAAEGIMNNRTKKRFFHQVTLSACSMLSKITFLVNVLLESPSHQHLAFRLGLVGIEMARPPASTKALEVKMAHQEVELVNLLKKIPLGKAELLVIRQRARALRDGVLQSRGDALLPLTLALFIFESFITTNCYQGPVMRGNSQKEICFETDEDLAFEAAVVALGLKANVSEADYPLVCEGTRRQRGDLACALLIRYKDDHAKLEKIMDRLLDKDIHQMYSVSKSPQKASPSNSHVAPPGSENQSVNAVQLDSSPGGISMEELQKAVDTVAVKLSDPRKDRLCTMESEDSSAFEEDNKDWEGKLRCTVFKPKRRHGEGTGGVDSSAPETTSSDNSPTMVRRHPRWRQTGPASDSCSSGDSSTESRESSFRREEEPQPVENFNPKPVLPALDALARSSTPCVKGNKPRIKRSPTEPNQPSEALAHFMFELAKTVLQKAGGNTSTAIFQPGFGQNHVVTHHGLHMCAFQIGLYALGINNCINLNWQSRTYSSHVSWISGQAMEIGANAINFLIETWERHLTPSEVAALADKASRNADLHMVRAAAELALTALPHSQALNPNEIQRALAQCKEQSPVMLEQALIAVESAAKGGGVCPDALFDVAHKWFDMFAEAVGEIPLINMEHQDHALFNNNQLEHHQNILPIPFPIRMPQYPFLGPSRHHGQYFVPPHHNRIHHSVPHALVNSFYHNLAPGLVLQGNPPLPVHHPVVAIPQQPLHPQFHNVVPPIPPAALRYINQAFRVGMLAMETLARRLHDGQTNKYSKNPPYGDFVRWLFTISKRLGYGHVQQFCMATVHTVSSPYVLWEIAVDAAQYLANSNNPHAVSLQLRSPSLQQLVQKSLQMFNSCLRQKLHHISPSDFEDFVATVTAAQSVYLSVPNGLLPFQQLLSEIRRSKSCKRELLVKLEASFGPIAP